MVLVDPKSISKFREYDIKSATRKKGKDKNPMQRASTEFISHGQRIKQFDRMSIILISSSSSSTSAVQSFTTPTNSGNNFQRNF